MSASKSHETAANRIASKLNVEYNKGRGPDIVASNVVVEVETERSVNEGLLQLRGYKKPVYIAATNKDAVRKALEKTKNTTVGVMNSHGNIIKKSTRKKGGK